MAKRFHNPRLAKIHRSYTVDEAADIYGVDKNTVRNWIKGGLLTCDSKRPILIMGRDLNIFHANRRTHTKRKCKDNEMYCFRCRAPQVPILGLVELKQDNEKTGNLIGMCSSCETMMYRRVSMSKVQVFSAHMGFTLPQAHLHIVNRD